MKVTIDDGAGAVIVDLAARRQAVPAVPDPAVVHRLSPAAMRLLGTAMGDFAERLDGALTTRPVLEPVYLDDGHRASIAIILTVSVDDLNRAADEHELERGANP